MYKLVQRIAVGGVGLLWVSVVHADVTLPVRAADRTPTLPNYVLRIDADLGLNRDASGALSWDSVLGGGFGVTDSLEAGGQFVPLTLAPEAAFGQPLLYLSYVVVPGSWAVVPSLQVTVPLRGADAWAIDGLVVLSGSLSPSVGVTFGPSVSATFSEPVAVTATLPIGASLQLTERAQLGAQSGLGFARFDPRVHTARVADSLDLNEATVPLGGSATYTLGRDGGPFVDVGLQFQWPALVSADPAGDAVNSGDWTVLLVASTYVET